MTRALITELVNTLERMDGWLKVRHFSGLMPDEITLVKAAREYLATKPSDERSELVADCRAYVEHGMSAAAIKLARRAADMLEADARELETDIAHPIKPITINLSQCTQLLEMFGGCAETEIILLNGNGHSGSGVYAYYDELPEEGAEILT